MICFSQCEHTVASRYLEYPLSRTTRYLEQLSRSLGHLLGTVAYSLSRTLVISNKFLGPLGSRDNESRLYRVSHKNRAPKFKRSTRRTAFAIYMTNYVIKVVY